MGRHRRAGESERQGGQAAVRTSIVRGVIKSSEYKRSAFLGAKGYFNLKKCQYSLYEDKQITWETDVKDATDLWFPLHIAGGP